MTDTFGDMYAVGLQLGNLIGVIREQFDVGNAQAVQNFGCGRVAAGIDGQTQVFICFDGVQTRRLQLVSPDFVSEPDPASLMATKVYDDATVCPNMFKSRFQLGPALTLQ